MTKKSDPEHHQYTYFAIPETIIKKKNYVQPVHRLTRPAYCSQPERNVRAAPQG